MKDIEENPKNPEITITKYRASPNHFLIKYKNEENRKKFAEIVMKFVQKHEIKDFHIEEKQAYEEERILFNLRTVNLGNDIDYKIFEKEVLKIAKNLN